MRNVDTDENMAKNAATRESASGLFKDKMVLIPRPLPLPPVIHFLGATEHISLLLLHLGQRVLIGADPFGPQAILPGYVTNAEINEGNSKLLVTLNALQFKNGKLHKAQVISFKLWKEGVTPITSETVALTELPQLLSEFTKVSVVIEDLSTKLEFNDQHETSIALSYKGRPLNGIWATAPYLHNGSVRTLDDLLKPAKERKPFHVGSREFDPVNVGYEDKGDFSLDPNIPGSSNAGHDEKTYGGKIFDETERKQLIEYLKKL